MQLDQRHDYLVTRVRSKTTSSAETFECHLNGGLIHLKRNTYPSIGEYVYCYL